MTKITPDPPFNLQDTLVQVNELLHCAAATAYEASDQLNGQQRHLSFSVMHLVEIAQALVERSLISIESSQKAGQAICDA